jgi:hypothetical protein
MNEKRYFIFWLILGSLLKLILVVIWVLDRVNANNMGNVGTLTASELMEQPVSVLISGLVGIALVLLISTIILALGMDFAKKIGVKFLLLQENHDLKKDILYPAIIAGVAVSCIVIVASVISPFELFSFFETESYFFSYKTLMILLATIQYDIRLLLFWISGLALLIKKVTRSASMDTIMYTSIVLIALLFNMSSPMWNLGTSLILSNPMLVFGPAMRCGIDIMLGTLFWKKGFEVAVLCHVIIVFLFYTLKPLLLNSATG